MTKLPVSLLWLLQVLVVFPIRTTAIRGKRNIDTPAATTAATTATATTATANATTSTISRQKNNENDNNNNNNNDNVQETLSGLTLGDVWDFVSQSEETSPSGACERQEFHDVIVIGAGMAGVAAASRLQAVDPSLSYVVLESTDRVGGRMRSVTFGVSGNSRTVEDGANWILSFDDNPIFALAEATGLQTPVNDLTDVQTYFENGTLLDPQFRLEEQKICFWHSERAIRRFNDFIVSVPVDTQPRILP
jgi:Flavin containing amine oxidoreductase